MTETHRTIGRYEIQEEIGRGSMGVVYRAYDPLLRRLIALKTILVPPGMAPEAMRTFEDRFFEEARAAARLSHPAIVAVHDVGRDETSGLMFMALEYLCGETIAQLTAAGQPIEWREALRIAETLAEALYHASLIGVVHRDIKPANVMVLPTGHPKIMDFGIARIETARLKLTRSGESFGTPLYMSPEQALGGEVDHRTDLFSLGAVLYRMVTGRDAFAAANIPKILYRIANEEPEPPSRANPRLPPDIDLVVGRALAKDVETRYPDAKALADDIRDMLNERRPRHRGEVQLSLVGSSGGEEILELVEDATPEPLVEIATPVDAAARSEEGEGATEATRTVPPPTRVSVPPAARTSEGLAGALRALSDRLGTRGFAAVALLLALVALVAWWHSAGRAPVGSAPTHSISLASGSSAPSTTVSSRPGVATDRSSPPAKRESPAGPVPSADLLIDFEHHLKRGVLRVWVDDAPVMDEAFSSQSAKKIVAITLNRGHLKRRLTVPTGRHLLRVQVRWDDDVKTETIAGAFVDGTSRTLKLRLNRLTKALSLGWS